MIRLDPMSSTPPFEQIRAQLADSIDSGALKPGARLPTIRRLAADLGLATNTVARAYRELERTGHLRTTGRGGTFVTGNSVDHEARTAARSYLQRAQELGLTAIEAAALVDDVARSGKVTAEKVRS